MLVDTAGRAARAEQTLEIIIIEIGEPVQRLVEDESFVAKILAFSAQSDNGRIEEHIERRAGRPGKGLQSRNYLEPILDRVTEGGQHSASEPIHATHESGSPILVAEG